MKTRYVSGVLGLAMLGLTACGPTLGSLPLPGKGVGGDTIHVTMEFGDALNLAQGAPVKINGVDEGKVQSIWVVNFHAVADVVVKKDAQLRNTMTARLRYTTPLGELYVDVANPTSGGTVLTGGETIPISATTTAPTVEDALAQAGALINGGGLGAIEKISTELKHAFVGKEPVWRDLLGRLNYTVTQANASTKDIDAALTALNGVAVTLGKNREIIHRSLKEIAPAAAILKSQAPNLTQLLVAVQKFGTQANSTLEATRTDLLTTLSEVQPVLAELVSNRPNWAKSLDAMGVLANAVQRIIPGDYLNLGGSLSVSQDLLNSLGGAAPAAGGASKPGSKSGSGGLLSSLPGLGGLLPTLPGLGNLLPSGGSSCAHPLLGLCL